QRGGVPAKGARIAQRDGSLAQRILDVATRYWSGGLLPTADKLVAQSDVDDARAQLGLGRTALITAHYDLRRALGVVDQRVDFLDLWTCPCSIGTRKPSCKRRWTSAPTCAAVRP